MKNPLRSSAQLIRASRASFLHEEDDAEDDDDKWLNNATAGGLGGSKEIDELFNESEATDADLSAAAATTATTATANSSVDASAHRTMMTRSRGVADATTTTTTSGTSNNLRASSNSSDGGTTESYTGHSHSYSDDDDSDDDSYSSSSYSSSSSISGYGFNSVARRTISSSGNNEEEVTPHALAAQVAESVKSKFVKNLPRSLKQDYESRDCIAPYKTDEIVLGPLLGSGEFSHVYEIKAFRPGVELESTLSPEEIETRQHMKRRERYHDTKKACYAVKHLRPKLLEKYTKLEYAQSASDLAMEAEFLASLQHPNIIKLRGISASGAGGFENGPKGYFLIIDRLNETLVMRMKTWKKQQRRRNKLGHSLKKRVMLAGAKHKELLAAKMSSASSKEVSGGKDGSSEDDNKSLIISEEQVHVGLQISSALMYLHENNIMFRDLKPQNIGFDVRGDVKLFDFGLATVMPIFGDPYEDEFNMSGAGSPRYMAPEVLIDPPEKYNLKADVYTFGIVLWEMFSLEPPFSNIKSRNGLVEHVVHQGDRPTINDNWPEPIKEVLHLSFDPDMAKRPSIQLFYNLLRVYLLDLRNGDDTGLDNAFIKRRRSINSMRDLDIQSIDDDEGHQEQSSQEKFPQRVRDKILSHVKSPTPASFNSNNSNGDDNNPEQPQRRRRNKLRDKFRLSINQEE